MVNLIADPNPDPVYWDYFVLKSIELYRGTARLQVRLLCEEDAEGWRFYARCDDTWLFYLDPYAKLLLESQRDLSVETPHIPIYRDSTGRAHFCLRGAEADYPYLRVHKAFDLSGPWFRKRFKDGTAALAPFIKQPT